MKRDYLWVRFKRKILNNVWLSRFVLASFLFLSLGTGVYFMAKSIDLSTPKYYLSIIESFLFPQNIETIRVNKRINILVLGKSSIEHEGSDLTDTIIFASIPTDVGNFALISIPRDVWVSEIRAKINSAYYWGNQKKVGGGIALSRSLVEDIVGQPINYVIVIDFSGFKNIIDAMGGIDVDVETSFVDDKYPIEGREDDLCGGDFTYACRYEKIEFKNGPTYMDGGMALKFVRSRNAVGEEGTDIARGKRQQKIITAIKNKLLSSEIYLSPKKIESIANAVITALEVDFDYIEGAAIFRKIIASANNIKDFTIPEGYLINPPVSAKYDNQYVFTPAAGNWEELHKWIKSLLN